MSTLASPPSFTSSEFREVMANVPTSVCVVAAHGDDGPAGLTVGTFVSVSLDPPLVGVLVAETSTSWPRVAQAGKFCISVLGDDHEHVCRRFAISGGDKFSGIDWDYAPSGAPRLPGAVAWIDCELRADLPAGDHRFAIGRVTQLGVCPGADPLVFVRGRLCRVGNDEKREV